MKYLLLSAMLWLMPLIFLLCLSFPLRKCIKRTRALRSARQVDDPAGLIAALDEAVSMYTIPSSPFRSDPEFDAPPTGDHEEYRDFFHYHVLATLEEKAGRQRGSRIFFIIIAVCLSLMILLPLACRPSLIRLFVILPSVLILGGAFLFVALYNRESRRQLEMVREIDAKLRMGSGLQS